MLTSAATSEQPLLLLLFHLDTLTEREKLCEAAAIILSSCLQLWGGVLKVSLKNI